MKLFLETKLDVIFDGVWQTKEILLLTVHLTRQTIDSRKLRKDTIFSHRKNKYKDGIGKRRNRKY